MADAKSALRKIEIEFIFFGFQFPALGLQIFGGQNAEGIR